MRYNNNCIGKEIVKSPKRHLGLTGAGSQNLYNPCGKSLHKDGGNKEDVTPSTLLFYVENSFSNKPKRATTTYVKFFLTG